MIKRVIVKFKYFFLIVRVAFTPLYLFINYDACEDTIIWLIDKASCNELATIAFPLM